jgi:hypothetical protein
MPYVIQWEKKMPFNVKDFLVKIEIILSASLIKNHSFINLSYTHIIF